MFSLTLPNARHFKRCCDCLRDVVHEVRVRITPEGLVASAEANGTHVSAHFHAKHAIEYKADLSCMMRPETCTFGLATDTLAKLLRAASAEQRVKVSLAHPELRFELYTERHASRFTMPTLDMPPAAEFAWAGEPRATAALRTDHLRALLRDLRHVGERVAVEVVGGALVFYGQSDNTTGEVVTREATLWGEEACFGVYSLGLLQHFLKAQHVAPLVSIAFHDHHLRLTLESDVTLALTLQELGGAL